MLKYTLVAALTLAGLGGVAVAQTTSPSTPSPSPSPPPSMSTVFPGSTMDASQFSTLDIVSRFANQNFTDQARVKASPADWRRANQAAMLINEQRCDNAYTLAVVELDDRLAQNVKHVCKELAQH